MEAVVDGRAVTLVERRAPWRRLLTSLAGFHVEKPSCDQPRRCQTARDYRHRFRDDAGKPPTRKQREDRGERPSVPRAVFKILLAACVP
jgi:hypothetical protein